MSNILKSHDVAPAMRSLMADEIDFRLLFNKVWSRKLWLIIPALLAVIVSVSVVLNMKPIYQLKASFRPELLGSFADLNAAGLIELTPQLALQRYRTNLESKRLRKLFFSLPSIREGFFLEPVDLSVEQQFAMFDRLLKVEVPVERINTVLVSDANQLFFKHENPVYGVVAVNELIDFVNTRTVAELNSEYLVLKNKAVSELEKKVADTLNLESQYRLHEIVRLKEKSTLKLINLSDELLVLQEKATAKRKDRISAFEEAISIASALNIKEPTSLSRMANVQSVSVQMAMTTDTMLEYDPLYLRGTRLLKAELQVLGRRKNDDFTDSDILELRAQIKLESRNREVEALETRKSDIEFVAEKVQPLLERLEELKNIKIDLEGLRLVRVDQQAYIPEKAIVQNKRLIVLFSVIICTAAGLLLAMAIPNSSET